MRADGYRDRARQSSLRPQPSRLKTSEVSKFFGNLGGLYVLSTQSSALSPQSSVWGRLVTYGRMIKLSHTVFALPFALSAAVLAQRSHPLSGADLVWLLLAMVGARSAAMGFNRIADAGVDARNPRTEGREIPAGRISAAHAGGFVVLFSALFILSAGMLGQLPLILSGPTLAILFLYSYTKRFTWLAHLYLGFAISLAPAGAWVAITGGFSPEILLLSLALMTYIAGFDILYACQDAEFDRAEGLRSIPARFGIRPSLLTARGLHLVSFGALLGLIPAFGLGPIYIFFTLLIGGLMVVEHCLVRPDDLSRIDIAFFHVNSLISVLLFLGVLADEGVRRWG
jgi:4-hydroxybenzoate polyprenyltransferase